MPQSNHHRADPAQDDALLATIAAHRIRTLYRQSRSLRAMGLTDTAAILEQWAEGLRADLTPPPARIERTRTVGIWRGGAR